MDKHCRQRYDHRNLRPRHSLKLRRISSRYPALSRLGTGNAKFFFGLTVTAVMQTEQHGRFFLCRWPFTPGIETLHGADGLRRLTGSFSAIFAHVLQTLML